MDERTPPAPGRPVQPSDEEPVVLMQGRPVRLSVALQEYARPLLELATSEEEVERAMAVAVICWNAAELSEAQQQEFLRRLEAQGALPPDVLADFTREFERMKARKRELFG